MSSLEDGFGGGVDDIVSANTGELRNPFWEVGYHGFTGLCGTPVVPIAMVPICKWPHKYCARSYSPDWDSRTTRRASPGYYDTLPPPLRLDPMCCMNLGLSLSGGE